MIQGKDSKNQKPQKLSKIHKLTKSMCNSDDAALCLQPSQAKRKRIMNYKLIQVSGFPRHLANLKVLGKAHLFGRYGDIVNIFVGANKEEDQSQSETVRVYVTYESQLNSSLALLGVHNIKFEDYKLEANYGTNRYCNSFLISEPCHKEKCFYLHSIDSKNDAHKPEHGKQRHIEKALNIVKNNLWKTVAIQLDECRDRCTGNGAIQFRTVENILQRMISRGIIQEKQYEKIKKRGKLTTQKTVILTKNTFEYFSTNQDQTTQSQPTVPTPSSLTNSQQLPQTSPFTQATLTKQQQQQSNQLTQKINNRIAQKILRQLRRKRQSSRFQFAQLESSVQKQVMNQKANRIRETMRKFLISG